MAQNCGNIHELLTCPYNKAHKVGATTFATHLIRCAKQYPLIAENMEICPYNQSHHVLKSEMSYHLAVCPDFMRFRCIVLAHELEEEGAAARGGAELKKHPLAPLSEEKSDDAPLTEEKSDDAPLTEEKSDDAPAADLEDDDE